MSVLKVIFYSKSFLKIECVNINIRNFRIFCKIHSLGYIYLCHHVASFSSRAWNKWTYICCFLLFYLGIFPNWMFFSTPNSLQIGLPEIKLSLLMFSFTAILLENIPPVLHTWQHFPSWQHVEFIFPNLAYIQILNFG